MAGARPVVVADARLGYVSSSADVIPVDADDITFDTVTLLRKRLAAARPRTVIGLGGGSVLDAVKLATTCYVEPRTPMVVAGRGARAGLVVLPQPPRTRPSAAPRLILAPTTVGTGSEVSRVACAVLPAGRRLVLGEQLCADVAVLDPDLTGTLPCPLLAEGVLEALLRVLGPVVGSSPVGGLPDREAASLVGRLREIGDDLACGRDNADVRLEAAVLSAATHTGWALVGRGAYSAKHWYLANELSTALGVRKMTATACLLPAMWGRIKAGDHRFGGDAQLTRAWSWVAGGDPVDGIGALLDRWGIGRALTATAEVLGDVANRAVASWGGALPMLGGLDVADVRKLYFDAVRGHEPCWA